MNPEFVRKFKIPPQTSEQLSRTKNALFYDGEVKPEIQEQIDLVLNAYKDKNTYCPEIEQAMSVVFDLEAFDLSDVIVFMRNITMKRVTVTYTLYPWFADLMQECGDFVRQARSYKG